MLAQFQEVRVIGFCSQSWFCLGVFSVDGIKQGRKHLCKNASCLDPGSGNRIRTSDGAFFSVLIGWFVGLLSRVCVVSAYVCLVMLMRVERFCSLFCSHV